MNVKATCAGNNNLQDAKKRKNDEFYTRYADIEEELQHYRAFLADKSILCNCNDANSNFWKYFHRNFGDLGLSKLIATHYDKNNPSYKLEYAGGDDINLEDCHRSRLIQDGDFRSAECIHLLEESDIVVTNAREVFGLTARNRINKGFPGHTPLFLYPEMRAERHRKAA